MNHFKFRTTGQKVIRDTLVLAARESKRFILVDQQGSGYRHVIEEFRREVNGSYVKSIFLTVVPTLDMREVLLEIYKKCGNIRFSSLRYRYAKTHELMYLIGSRLRQDLLGKKILIAFNHVDCIKSLARLNGFVKMLESIPFPCGIVIRTSRKHLLNVKKNDSRLFTDLKIQWKIKMVPRVTKEDIRTLCLANGINDRLIITEMIAKHRNLKITQYYLDRIKTIPNGPIQLALFPD